MKNTDWPASEVEKVAGSSGKPLEVTSALAFKKRQWDVHLGSYYADVATGLPRELDVLAERSENLEASNDDIKCRLRIFVSCKGFPPNQSPVAYSVSYKEIPGFQNRFFMHNHQGIREDHVGRIEMTSAAYCLKQAGLSEAPKLVAYDVMQAKEIAARGATPATTAFESLGDRTMFAGLDSALKVALYWRVTDRLRGDRSAVLYVPVLLLGVPFWQVSIDGGKIGTAEIRKRGYQTSIYPVGDQQVVVTTLVWAVDDLQDLVELLESLFNGFVANVRNGPR